MTAPATDEMRGPVTGRIGVGVDIGPSGLAALAWATEEAIAAGARMTICHVRDHGDPHAAAPDLETLRLTQPDLVRRVRWCRQLLGGANATLELPLGDAAAALLELGERVDLLVLGGGRDAALPHRSRIAWIAAQAACPVVVVRPVPGHGNGPFAGHVVIGVDGSPGSAAPLRFGLAHASRHHLPVAIVRVDPGRPAGSWWDDRGSRRCADPAAPHPPGPGIRPVDIGYPHVTLRRAVVGGDPLTGLRRAAAGAVLLVLGRSGHRRPPLPRLGPVIRGFAQRADCPVAIVPPDPPDPNHEAAAEEPPAARRPAPGQEHRAAPGRLAAGPGVTSAPAGLWRGPGRTFGPDLAATRRASAAEEHAGAEGPWRRFR